MVRASAIARNNGSSLDMIDTHDAATPTGAHARGMHARLHCLTRSPGVQLLAKSVGELSDALSRLEACAATTRPHYAHIAAVDLNFGCPSPDVIRNGSGPAMLKRRGRLAELFAVLVAFKRDAGLDIGAVGVKIRLGLNRSEADAKVYLPLVDAANEAGLDYITVHARHAGQRSREPPAWEAIAEVKQRAAMPVIGNGDVFSAADAAAMRQRTGCDGVMLARAAIRNPWVFADFRQGAGGAAEGSSCDGGRYWPSVAEVDAAAAQYAATAAAVGTKPKFVAFHERNFERLRRVALTGDRGIAVDSPATIHLT